MTNSEISPEKRRELNFFDNEVSMYILKDIDKLNEIRPNKEGECGLTVPSAIMLFAVIDLFGYLTRDDSNPKKTCTLENFKYLLSKKAGFFPKIYEVNCDKIVKLFRHGVMHQFFPKASGIAKAGENNPLLFESSGIPILNVDVLSKDVKEALGKIKQSVIQNLDNTIVDRINNRLDKLAKEDYETLSTLI